MFNLKTNQYLLYFVCVTLGIVLGDMEYVGIVEGRILAHHDGMTRGTGDGFDATNLKQQVRRHQ